LQNTIKSSITFTGQGLHSGHAVSVTLHPAAAESGIWFRRTDVDSEVGYIKAHWDAVNASQLCTLLVNEHGVSLSTVEHIMAALAGCGVHNVMIEVDANEVPILDGSAAPFVEKILAAGIVAQNAPVRAIEVLRSVVVDNGRGSARLDPAQEMSIEFTIDFDAAAIGRQNKVLKMANGAFIKELSDSRTFCLASDVDAMHAAGLAKGGTMENAVVVDGADVLSPGGLRHADEAVRHKMLDAMGDLMLAGGPILGRYTGIKSGHALTNLLLRKLFSDPENYRMITCDDAVSENLPGSGIDSSDLLRSYS